MDYEVKSQPEDFRHLLDSLPSEIKEATDAISSFLLSNSPSHETNKVGDVADIILSEYKVSYESPFMEDELDDFDKESLIDFITFLEQVASLSINLDSPHHHLLKKISGYLEFTSIIKVKSNNSDTTDSTSDVLDRFFDYDYSFNRLVESSKLAQKLYQFVFELIRFQNLDYLFNDQGLDESRAVDLRFRELLEICSTKYNISIDQDNIERY